MFLKIMANGLRSLKPFVRRRAPLRLGHCIALALAIIVQTGTIVLAQATATSTAPPIPAAASCELHIWPAPVTHSSYLGWFHGGVVDGNLRGFKGYPNMYADALDLPQQVALLNQIDWRVQMSDPTLTVIVHDTPTGSDDDRTRTARVIAHSPPCYKEVIIKASIVEAYTFSSRSVRLVSIRKNFEGPTGVPVNFTSTSEGLVAVPEQSAADFDGKMRVATQNAYLTAVRRFIVSQLFH